MKNIIIIFLISSISIIAQSNFPGPMLLRSINMTNPTGITAPEQTNFLIGSWWGHDMRITDNHINYG